MYTEAFGAANSGLSATGQAFKPETAQQYEAGLKAELLERRLAATLAFYDLTKQNILTSDPLNPGFSVQTGEARSRGVELDLNGQITARWSVSAAYALTDARITQDNDGNQGKRLLGTPEHAASLWTRYRLGGDWAGWTLGAGVFAQSERQGDNANSFQVPGYGRIDLLAAYAWKVGRSRLTAQLNVENALEKVYFTAPGGRGEIHPGTPRTFTASLRAEF